MVNRIRRFFPLFFSAALLFFSAFVNAQETGDQCTMRPVKEYGGTNPWGDGTKIWNKNPESVCQAIAGQYRTYTSMNPSGDSYLCIYQYTEASGLGGESVSVLTMRIVEEQVCPTCASKAGQVYSSGYYDYGADPAGSISMLACAEGCSVIFDGISPAGSALVDGVKHYYAKGSYRFVDMVCNGDAMNPPTNTAGDNLPPDKCAAGQAQGTVNGKPVCIDQSGEQTTPPDESKTTEETTVTDNPDGTKTTVTTTTTVNPDGSTSTKTETKTCDSAGNCTTTTNTTNTPGIPSGGGGGGGAGGGTGDDGTGAEPGPCQVNPNDAQCVGDGVPVGGLYEGKGRTVEQVLNTRMAAIKSSPIGSVASSFFSVSGGGSCPTWSGSFALYEKTMTMQIDVFCEPWVANALLVLKVAVLLVASFFAFRIAVE